jgi:Na+-translocating ferredoxin:NAD+ oxidoreductase subunit E
MDKTMKNNIELTQDQTRLLSIFTKGIFKENSVFVMALGLSPALAVTSSFEGALGMGILVFLILTLTNIILSALRHLIPHDIRSVVYVMIIATEVTILKMFVDAFAPALASELGIFIALITVNMIILSRAEAFASQHHVFASMLDGMGVALGFTLSLSLIGFLREWIGTGTIELGQILPLGFEITLFESLNVSAYALDVFITAPGAFFTVGLLLAFFIAMKQKKGAK